MESTQSLLCVSNFQANSGYAWSFIESLFAMLADHLAPRGIRTLVAYPLIRRPPKALEGHAAEPILLDTSFATTESIDKVAALVRREGVKVVYLTDRPVRSRAYAKLRRAGVRRIIVHVHRSGAHEAPRGLKKMAKRAVASLPGINADLVIAVSDFVARRQREVAMVPARRVVTIWNTLPIPPLPRDATNVAHDAFALAHDRPLIVCACRATQEKGVDVLLRAFNRLLQEWPGDRPRPALVYFGDGPAMPELRTLQASLPAGNQMILAGFRGDSAEMLNDAAVCVVPSVVEEGFCLSVLEGMLRAKPVVATRGGAIPELIEHGVSGLLVERSDDAALALAIRKVLDDPSLAARLAAAARRRAVEQFDPVKQAQRLKAIVEEPFL